MSVFDLDDLLKEIDPAKPAGDDLEYDPDFVEMESLAASGNDQIMIESPSALEPHSADWQGVKTKSLELFQRTLDLRVAIYLVRSALVCDGLAGFAQGLRVLRGLVERFWQQVHPQLDAGDDYDPTLRVNTIAMLRGRSETLDLLVSAPFVESKKAGNFSFRDVQVATGEIHPGPDVTAPPALALIEAAFLDCELEGLQATAAAINESLGDIKAIDQSITGYVGSAQALSLGDLTHTLEAMQKFVDEQLSKRGVDVGSGDSDVNTSTNSAVAKPVEQIAAGEITSREAAVDMMEKISRYYTAHEPSSPIPLLMQRAKRLSSMDFMHILEDLAPGALNQLQSIAGPDAGAKGGGAKDEG